MTSIIQFGVKELEALVSGSNACVVKRRLSQNIAFQPWCLANLKDSLQRIMNNKIGKYDEQLNGIILSYKNVKILDDIYAINKDNSELFSDVEADFYVFKPVVGATLKGIITKKCFTHLGVLVHKVFNVVIPTPLDQTSSTWIGSKLNVGQEVKFKVIVLDLFGALPYIRGALDESSLPSVSDEGDSNMDFDTVKLSSSHVNFDGTKPKFLKNSPKPNDSIISKNSNFVKIPVKSKNKSKKKDVLPSDSDLVSDVDDVLLKEQEDMVKKIMSSDKKKNKIKASQTLTPSTPGLKKLLDKNNQSSKYSETPQSSKKGITDAIVIRNKRISISGKNIVDNNGVSNTPVHQSTKINNATPSNTLMRSPTIVKNNGNVKLSPESIKNVINKRKNDLTIYSDIEESNKSFKKEKKRSSSCVHNSDSETKQKKSKRNYSAILLNTDKNETDFNVLSGASKSRLSIEDVDEKKARKLEKKRLKEERRSSFINEIELHTGSYHNSKSSSPVNTTPSKELTPVKSVISDRLCPVVTLSPRVKKRKRKFSESFGDTSTGSVSCDTPLKKKMKKEKSLSEDQYLPESSESEVTKEKKKKKEKYEDNTNESSMKVTKSKLLNNSSRLSNSNDDRLTKVQDIFLELAKDPSLLSDIQELIKSRRSK